MELSTSIHILGDILGKVISELESPEIFAVEERIRALQDTESAEAQALREVIGLTINGIAAGLRNTG